MATLDRRTVTATVESLSHEGRGVAHLDGKAVFIAGALPGERVEFVILRRRGRYDEGELTAVLEAAPERVMPKCPHYAICGGCSLQHLAPAAQVWHKQSVLIEQLTHMGRVTPAAVLPAITAPVWGYRRKARLSVKFVEKKGRLLLGFKEKSGRFVADLTRCEVLHPSVGERIESLRALLDTLSVRKQIPQVEVAVGDQEIALVLRHLTPLSEADLQACRAYADREQISFYTQPGGTDSVRRLWPEGNAPLHYVLPSFDLRMAFEPTDFTQVNADINRSLIAKVLELLDLSTADQVLDLFCGLGNFTLPMAQRAESVVGVEGDPQLVARAARNAADNGIANVEFMAANLSRVPLTVPFMHRPYTKLLLDPPRTGALEIIQQLDYRTMRRIVYVSCNPATLARDARVLIEEQGYALSAAGVLDMFPHTAHVESIAVFDRR